MTQHSHGGNVWRLAREADISVGDLLDFSSNINPLGPPQWLRGTINAAISDLVNYPDPDCARLISALATHHQVDRDSILAANGSAEILSAIPRITGFRRAVIPVPSYVDYRKAAETARLEVFSIAGNPADAFRLDLDRLRAVLQPGDIVFLGQPNNPTGTTTDPSDIRSLAQSLSGCLFAVDEAFIDFFEGTSSLIENRPDNVVVLRSFTKILAIPGLRLGYVIADSKLISQLRGLLPPWSVNHLAQEVGTAALSRRDDYLDQTHALVSEQRRYLMRRLGGLSQLRVFPSDVNFLLVQITHGRVTAPQLADRLLTEDRIAIRTCTDYEGLDKRHFRIAVRTTEANKRLCDALGRIFNGTRCSSSSKSRPTPALMFQGTASGAGKSLLTAAFCRILLEEGLRVAPFKSQNMSLNSFVSDAGGEMGRAQVLQAQACRLPPDVRMNPILLKPSSDTGSQVIVLGRPVANMSVERYIRYKPQAFERAKKAYDDLASEHDVMVLEGAGSPAEINLARHDIANMAMAHHAEARVLIVGDIDRGGVFAAFRGTLDVLSEGDRLRVAGFVVNKFRGRAELLGDAFEWVQQSTGRPVVGIVPFLPRIGLPEEDSVALEGRQRPSHESRSDCLGIGVVRLPHISNFTDFDSLAGEHDVSLRFLENPHELEDIQILILPGSKNVMEDAVYLHQHGWNVAVHAATGRGVEIVGICGGYQLLGQKISDPNNLESSAHSVAGLGLLSVDTTLEVEKTLRRAVARYLPTNHTVHGYEIHHGRTFNNADVPVLERDDGTVIGNSDRSGLIWGTYLHGLFDDNGFRRHFINRARLRVGLAPLEAGVSYDIEPAIQRFADAVRASVDVDFILRDLGIR